MEVVLGIVAAIVLLALSAYAVYLSHVQNAAYLTEEKAKTEMYTAILEKLNKE